MSRNLLDNWKSGNSSDQRSNFAQTCNLLSQYLKGKAPLIDPNLGKPEAAAGSQEMATTTMNLQTGTEKSSAQDIKSLDLFPQHANMGCSYTTVQDAVNNSTNSSEQATMEPKNAQMTIFYDGQVLVFDDFPASKAKEVMLLASKGTSSNTTGIVSNSNNGDKAKEIMLLASKVASSNTTAGFVSSSNVDKAKEIMLLASRGASSNTTTGFVSTSSVEKTDIGGNSMASGSKLSLSNSGSIQAQKEDLPHSQASGSDLPIARRASLHRFLEKRKDRATARAPYQVQNPASSSKPEGKFDLNL